MKPFDLEKAKAGKPICTRVGTPAEFIAHVPNARSDRQVLALVGDEIYPYQTDGRFFLRYEEDSRDLFMAPVKRTLWANVYRSRVGFYLGGAGYDTQEEAEWLASSHSEYFTTISFEVEE